MVGQYWRKPFVSQLQAYHMRLYRLKYATHHEQWKPKSQLFKSGFIGNDYTGSSECYHTIMCRNIYDVSYADCRIYLLLSYKIMLMNSYKVSYADCRICLLLSYKIQSEIPLWFNDIDKVACSRSTTEGAIYGKQRICFSNSGSAHFHVSWLSDFIFYHKPYINRFTNHFSIHS